MSKYNDLELSILGCFLRKPELLDKTILENKHFIKHRKIFIFFKEVYKHFGTLDLNLMYSISKNKYRTIEYISWILEYYGFPSMLKIYEKELIDLYNEKDKDKFIIEEVFDLANKLYAKNISTSDFKKQINEIYENANKMFEEVEYEETEETL